MGSDGKTEAVSLRLDEESREASEASTLPSTPEQPSPASTSASTAAPAGEGEGGRMSRTRRPKRGRRAAAAESRQQGLSLGIANAYSNGVRFMTAPAIVMQFSSLAVASGGMCLVVSVFSGSALVFLAVIAIGVCGMCYSVRQRGALEYLPSGVTELLTRTTLLEFLTDTSVFDAIKTYLVFMMGLSEDETQGVLASLPEDMQYTLTRPGIMHTLPRPFQDLLLPPNARAGVLIGAPDGREVIGPRRRHRGVETQGLAEAGGAAASRANEGGQQQHQQQQRHRDGEEGGAPVLGQLVWNPLPASLGQETTNGEEQEGEGEEHVFPQEEELDRAGGDASSSVDSEEERGRSASRHADDGGRARRNGVDDDGRDDNATRRRPWEAEAYPPHASRSLSPAAVRNRAATDVAEADGARSSRRVSSALPIPARRLGTAGWFGRTHANGSGNPPGPAATTAGGMVPSAERLVASILQRRVDGAVRTAWNAVDEQGVRRAALGSGIALAAHVAFSERARRQAGSMLRGSLLAALAGTATVCASLAYLKPGEGGRERTASSSASSDSDAQVEAEEEEPGADVVDPSPTQGPRRERGQDTLSRIRGFRDGLQRWMTGVSPTTRNMVHLLSMICLLLAVRKWQLLRRAARRAMMPRTMYGATLPS
ncbi:conserved unknown protein [Ectocarpus siliculosus]|uniref:Transmembrane protein n=1 Tax=Ectocarpus siliculosus TaxID=2880 RepID=D8LC52_ECTSI|nr:conserved unknown protein [Ectocarpus siliculosus]|eukprot:CBN79235.1 conserved unknown protein [Ectocarpus siliculosus]